jgi:hypothetical protein
MTAKKKRPRLRVILQQRPIYTWDLPHWIVQSFADGIVPEAVTRKAHRALEWQRSAERQAARLKLLARKAKR